MTEKGFTLMFPLVFAFLGGCLLFVGLLMVVLIVTLGDIPGPFGIWNRICGGGLFLVYVAYRSLGSLLSIALISFGSGLFFLGSILLIVASATGDSPYPMPHIGTGFVVGGLFSVYIGYRKLTKKLTESENQLLRY